MSKDNKPLSTIQKIALIKRYFCGLQHAYGIYDFDARQCRVVKAPVASSVIQSHIGGKLLYGAFPLREDRTLFAAADFDREDLQPIRDFYDLALSLDLPVYPERSKSKGYHIWMFFSDPGCSAEIARQVVHGLLTDIGCSGIEVFPKQDRLTEQCPLGNFIFIPLCGSLTRQGRTAFLDPAHQWTPHSDPWALLQSIQTVSPSFLKNLAARQQWVKPDVDPRHIPPRDQYAISPRPLLPCARRILDEGVSQRQRVTCFRLAIHLKLAGKSWDEALSILQEWAQKNRPIGGKRIITPAEIEQQAAFAYRKDYRGLGCEDPVIQSFCDESCIIFRQKMRKTSP